MLETNFKPILWIRRNMDPFNLFLLNEPLIITFLMMPAFFLHHQPNPTLVYLGGGEDALACFSKGIKKSIYIITPFKTVTYSSIKVQIECYPNFQ